MLEKINVFIYRDFPLFLQQITDKIYYVKGGRAYNIMFKDKTESVDWDINAVLSFKQLFETFLSNYAKTHKLTIEKYARQPENNYQMIQYGFTQYITEDPSDYKYIIDVNYYHDKFANYTQIQEDTIVINGIHYVTLNDFIDDLIKVYNKRYNYVYQSLDLDDINEDILSEVKELFFDTENETENETENDTETEKEKDKILTNEMYTDIHLFLINTKEQFINSFKSKYGNMTLLKNNTSNYNYHINTLNKIHQEVLNSLGNSDNIKADDIKRMYKTIDNINNAIADNDYEMDHDSENYLGEYLNIVQKVGANKLTLIELPHYYKKFMKTAKRVDNIINIDWDKLSDEYQQYIVGLCNISLQEKDGEPKKKRYLSEILDSRYKNGDNIDFTFLVKTRMKKDPDFNYFPEPKKK